MPHVESNILRNNLYLAIKVEFLRIVCSTLCLSDFITKVQDLIEHMKLFKNSISSSAKFPAILGAPKYSEKINRIFVSICL